ncbi:MAG: S9 family peptidase [Verrucomicrobia bacterium]|nr:S9 family peptidase [Verrucomicrobiota bacterium]MBV9297673.1 S9 family peptidase [Verrucomicrobiota bacterium]
MLLGSIATLAVSQPLEYPKPKKGDVVDDHFGTKVPDPYRWLEDTDAPETAEWVKAENVLTSAYLEKLPERAGFREQMTKLLNYQRYTVPDWKGHRYLYRKNDGLQNQSVIYTLNKLSDEPRVLLDPNQLASDGTVAVTSTRVSDDGRLLAYGVAASGSDWNEIRVRDIDAGKDLSDVVKWVKFSEPGWTKDSKGFFYSKFPEPKPTGNQTFATLAYQKVYYHRLGDPAEKDRLIYERSDDPDLGFGAEVSHDGRYLLMLVNKGAEDRDLLYFKDLGDPKAPNIEAPFQPIVDKFEGEFKVVGSIGNRLYLVTDLNAPRYKIVEIDLTDPSRDHWKEVVPESKELLEEASLVGGKLVIKYLVDAKNRLLVFDLEGRQEREIGLPALGTVGSLSGDPDRPELFYVFTSFLYPSTIYRYDVSSGQNMVFQKPSVDFDPDRYETKQIFYASNDGTKIPMFIVCKKGLQLDGNNPVFLTGYGGFNISMTPSFGASYAIWIEKGGVFALPNLRGGGEYGREWHESGMKEHKQHVFDDFISAAQTLIDAKYTTAKKIAIVGGSNGGLLVGAVLTQRPDLFGAAVAEVGVLDMLRFQKFTIGWAWQSDYGSSDTPEGFQYLFKYSPLHNIKEGTCYPPTLVTTGDHDDRVVPGHSFKFAATLQAAQACANPVLIRIETKAGHGSGKPISKIIEEQSDVLAFIWNSVAGAK